MMIMMMMIIIIILDDVSELAILLERNTYNLLFHSIMSMDDRMGVLDAHSANETKFDASMLT